MSADLTAEQLATLTPEEVAAITGEDEHSPEELAALQRLADQASGADDTEDGDDDADGNDAEAAAQAAAAEAAKAEAAKTKDDEAADAAAAADVAAVAAEKAAKAEPAQSVYKAELPAEFNQMVQDIATQEADLKQQFKDGDIDFEAYTEKQNELIDQRQTLNTQKIKAEISQEMSQQTAINNWQGIVNKNIEAFAKEQGGIDYRKDKAKEADLDQFVKILADKPENANQPMEWFVQEAHKRVKALHGIETATLVNKGDALADAAAKRKPDSSTAPKTLAQVPGGDGPGDIGSKFAHIDALNGEAHEDAIAAMTPAQRAAYLAE